MKEAVKSKLAGYRRLPTTRFRTAIHFGMDSLISFKTDALSPAVDLLFPPWCSLINLHHQRLIKGE